MFLQAAGMARSQVRSVADHLDFSELDPTQRALAELAWKASVAPVSLSYEDTLSARAALENEEQFLEAALVTAGFSFANRCADALGVRNEVPAFLGRWPEVRWRVMDVLSWAIRLLTEFENRPVKLVDADQCLGDLRKGMALAGMGELPPFFEKLRSRADLLEVQCSATRAALLQNGLDRKTNLSVAWLISATNRDQYWMDSSGRQLASMGVPLEPLAAVASGDLIGIGLSAHEREMYRFARDISLRPERTTEEQVQRLREFGMSDESILDLVAVCAAVAAGNRLNRMLIPEVVRESMPVDAGDTLTRPTAQPLSVAR